MATESEIKDLAIRSRDKTIEFLKVQLATCQENYNILLDDAVEMRKAKLDAAPPQS